MRIAIIGYGKMGKRIEALALDKGHEITHRIGSDNIREIREIKNADVAIEFTNPEAAVSNFSELAKLGIPVVTGTTGWYGDFEKVKLMMGNANIPFFYATNFSIGVQLTLAASNYLAGLMSKFPQYICTMEEWHHTAKKDAPSGTAITIAEGIIEHHSAYNAHALDESNTEDTLVIKAYREDEIPGTHKVTYRADADQITIAHEAFNRDGFALGAIEAAAFIVGKSAGIYTMKDLLKLEL